MPAFETALDGNRNTLLLAVHRRAPSFDLTGATVEELRSSLSQFDGQRERYAAAGFEDMAGRSASMPPASTGVATASIGKA